MKNWGAVLGTALATLLIAGTAGAQQQNKKIQIDMGDIHLKGQSTIKLKQKIKQQRPNINLNKFKLVRVRAKMKSKHGGGEVALRVGSFVGYRQRIPGHPQAFHKPNKYHGIVMQNNSGSSQGAWQLKIRGNVKVRKVVVVLKRKRRPTPPPVVTPPPAPAQTKRMSCSSWDLKTANCYVGFPVRRIVLIQQYSTANCIPGSTFRRNGQYITVSDGCRGLFDVIGF